MTNISDTDGLSREKRLERFESAGCFAGTGRTVSGTSCPCLMQFGIFVLLPLAAINGMARYGPFS